MLLLITGFAHPAEDTDRDNSPGDDDDEEEGPPPVLLSKNSTLIVDIGKTAQLPCKIENPGQVFM